jgi:two-component system response regulator PilR (NtrC family)
LSASVQNKLGDLIQDEEVDVRLISASHQDLSALMEQGLFNQDLYYRLNVMSVQMPELRDINEDIPVIAQHLLIKIAENYGENQVNLSECALTKLKSCRFLGNVRELRNTLERAFTLCDGNTIKADDLHIKEKVKLPETSQLDTSALSLPNYLENIEKQAIREALAKTRQNKTAAAKLLGVSFRTLRYRLVKLGLSKGEDGGDE